MMKKIYMTPETVIHEMEIHNVLASLSIDKVDAPEGGEGGEVDVDDSEKSKGFNGNLWDF